MKVAVLTVTKRSAWEKIAIDSLNRQTFQNFDWIIAAEKQFLDVGVTVSLRTYCFHSKNKGRVSNLNAALNQGLKNCIDTDYVIFYQDFIDLPEDCFEKLIEAAEETKGFVTTATINSNGKKDSRYTGKNIVRHCNPDEWESNVAIAPMEAIRELGGFDEDYDNGWSWDNVNIAERAAMIGYKFYIDESNNPRLLYHDKEPDINPELKPNGEFHTKRISDVKSGKYPLKLKYL